MRGRSDSLTWQEVFAAGLVLRPILIVPMAPSGPLAGSNMLPIGLAAVGAYLGLPMPWPLALAGYNIALAAVGFKAWGELQVGTGG